MCEVTLPETRLTLRHQEAESAPVYFDATSDEQVGAALQSFLQEPLFFNLILFFFKLRAVGNSIYVTRRCDR
jgi:hypothetical protein